jgi:selenocysteine-specific elongation factor
VVRFDKENSVLIHADFLEKARNELLETIAEYHGKFPLKVGLPKEELRSRTIGSRNQKLFNFLINQLTREERIVLEKDLVRLKDHRVTLAADQQKARKDIEEIYVKSELQPPYFKEIKDKFPGNTALEVLELMHSEGSLIKVKEDLYFHKQAIENLEKNLVSFLKEHKEITTPQFKDMTGTSRKYTIPLIEYFDRSQVTVRIGDSRVLRRK